MLDERIFHCFQSKACINGEVVGIGVAESSVLKEDAVRRGFENQCGDEGECDSWMAALVMLLRACTTADDFNHEWWGAHTFQPEWARKLDEFYGSGWLYFPRSPDDMSPKAIGLRLGYQLALNERRLETAINDQQYRKGWEDADFQKAIRGNEDLADKTRIVRAGFDSLEQYAAESYDSARQFRAAIFSGVSAKASPAEFVEFTEGFGAGAKRASEVDLWDSLSEFNEREEVVEILRDHFPEINALTNRAEITKFVRDHLSAARRAFLDDGLQWRTFTDRMREIYERIGLKKARRGRPRKNREIEES
jgi:hypothetical protein